MLLPLLLAALAPSFPGPAWSPSSSSGPEVEVVEEVEEEKSPLPPTLPLLPLHNASSLAPEPTTTSEVFPEKAAPEEEEEERSIPRPPTSPLPSSSPPEEPQQQQQQPCNISVQRQMLSSLLVRWGPLGFQAQCDLVLFSTGAGAGAGGGGGNGAGVRASFSAAFPRVGPPPLVIEPVGLAAGGLQQEIRLCVGCNWARAGGRRLGRLRSSPSSDLFPSSSSEVPAPPPAPQHHYHHHPHPHPWPQQQQQHQQQQHPQHQQGERLHFCCLDFSLEELKGDPGWRMNRKPVESTLVACFMTLVIIVWSVAALIWPVPIIAGFLPNGMEHRRAPSNNPNNPNPNAANAANAASSSSASPSGAGGAAPK